MPDPEAIREALRQLETALRGGTDPDTVTDGFGNTWPRLCGRCGCDTVEVVRPGKAQCSQCD